MTLKRPDGKLLAISFREKFMFVVRLLVLAFLAAYSYGMNSIPAGELNGFGKLIAFSGVITVPLLYMLPTIEAKLRNHRNIASIALTNLFLGWTLIGWVVALVWAFKNPEHVVPSGPLVDVGSSTQSSQEEADTKTCPYCAETVKAQAIKCKHCGSDLTA